MLSSRKSSGGKRKKMKNVTMRGLLTLPDINNPKYAFRCFLLKLDFIGDENKARILLSRLSGNGAFKGK